MLFSTLLRTIRPLAIASAVFTLGAVSLLAQASQAVPANRIVQPVDENARITLRGYVHPLANAANDRGVAPDSMPLQRLHLLLRRSPAQEASLQQLISAMHTPGSSSYHKWLSPAQFGQQFGPSDQDISTVESWLSSHGFQVSGVLPGRQMIEFSGNVAQLRDAFHAQIHRYLVNGSTHYATANNPQIPAAIAPVIAGFTSLNNFRLQNYTRVLGQASYNPKTHAVQPGWTYGSNTSQEYVLSPADFAVQYDLNPLYSAGINGTGQTIAIINESNINVSTVNEFRSLFGLSANPPTVIIDGNDPGINGINNPDGENYAADETYLDVEWSGAVAPDAHIDLVIAADTALEQGLFLAAEHAVLADVAPVISISLGQCESSLGSTNQFLNYLWEQAAAEGITVMVSAGDNGSAGCDDFNSQYYAVNGLAVSGFASTPYNVAVGGTDFYYSDYATGGASVSNYWNTVPSQSPSVSLQKPIPEQPWNDSQFGDDIINLYTYPPTAGTSTIAAGSGGASSAAVCSTSYDQTTGACSGTLSGYAKPAWQTGTGVPADKVRDLPDVSLFAADGLNYSFYPFCYTDGDCLPATGTSLVQISGAGGTSFAAPAFAGIMALVDQKYGPQGQADFVLYRMKAQFPTAFHDVTVGNNSVPCNTTTSSTSSGTYPPLDCIAAPAGLGYSVTDPAYGTTTEGRIGTGSTPDYQAAAGYNLATGLGSVDANQMVTDWGSVTFTPTTVTFTPASTSFAHGTNVTFTGSVTAANGTPTGDVALKTDSTTPLQAGESLFTLSNGSFTSGNINYLPGGTYNVWGQYGGDSNFAEGTSGKTQITVTPENSSIYFNVLNAATTTTGSTAINSSGSSVPYGTQLILAAQPLGSTLYQQCYATSNPPSSCNTLSYTYPTGSVVFQDNGTTIDTAQINAEGDAEYNGAFGVGTHSVIADYSGDASYNKSSATAITFTVTKATPSILFSASNATSSTAYTGGQATVLNIQVENGSNVSLLTSDGIPATNQILAPTGTVSVTGLPGGTVTAQLSAAVDPAYLSTEGVATVTLPASTPAGTYNIGVSYAGDSNYTSVASTPETVAISTPSLLASATTATVSGSISPQSSIAIKGTVTGQNGHPAPTGTVGVFSSGYTISQVELTPGTSDVSTFTLTLNSQNLSPGANFVTLQYAGDKNYNPSAFTLNTGDAISNPLSDFSITSLTPLVSVAASGTATTTLYLTPVNGFNGTVSLSCAPSGSPAPAGVACSLSQSSVSLSGSAVAGVDPHSRPFRLFAAGGGAALACVLLLSIPSRRRAWRNLLGLIVIACVLGFGVGCGGGGSSSSTSSSGGSGSTGTAATPTNPAVAVTLTVTTSGATAGNYGLTITGTSSATSQIHTFGVTAAVQ